jgi:hypothetical protein
MFHHHCPLVIECFGNLGILKEVELVSVNSNVVLRILLSVAPFNISFSCGSAPSDHARLAGRAM